MDRRVIDRWAPPVYAALVFVVIIAPAVAISVAAERGGMGGVGDGRDLLAGSSVLGAVHAVVAHRRLADEERVALVRTDIWIASVNSLVVLALATPLLAVAILVGFADEHASLADQNYPVVVLWVGIQLLAVALSEATGRFVFWWLEPGRGNRSSRAYRRSRARVVTRTGRRPPPRRPPPR